MSAPIKNPVTLSPQQLRVVEQAGRGLTNNGIAAALRISAHTVDAHWRIIFARLGTHSRTAAVLMVELARASRERGGRKPVTTGRSVAEPN